MLLFNLAQDPYEQTNLADAEPQRVEQMLIEIESFNTSLGELPPAKKTGKNMDYGPYIKLLFELGGKLLLIVLPVLLLLGWLLFRLVKALLSFRH